MSGKKDNGAEETKGTQTAAQENAPQEDVNKLKEELKKANEVIASNKELIKELNEQLASKEAENDKLSKYPVLTHKGVKYELIDAKSRARYEGKNVVITKEELEQDAGLFAFCIKKGFSCLRKKGGE